MKLLTIIGARPQFIKAAVVSRSLVKKGINEILLHTGQHYDKKMSELFFKELNIPNPKYNLGIKGGYHGAATGRMLEQIEVVLGKEKPDFVQVYGDTNSTLAGALAASKLHIPVVHVEAGLRSFNKKMPEEINRILTDHVSELLFAPTSNAVKNLYAEGIINNVYHTGDVMYDAALFFGSIARRKSHIIERLGVTPQKYYLVTIHRAENTDEPERMVSIVDALLRLNQTIPVVLPLHPRTKNVIMRLGIESKLRTLCLIEPVSFLDMISLEKNAKVIITDSGGVQKEAYYHSVPCVTLRDETEWVETVDAGWNKVAGANDSEKIVSEVRHARIGEHIAEYGCGDASNKIVDILMTF